MHPGLRIDWATEDDLPLILRFIQELAEYERMSHRCLATIEGLRETLFTSPVAEVLIARIDGVPAGSAIFCHSYSTFLAKRGIHLEDIFVDPTFRGMQVGYALLATLSKVAIERDCWGVGWAVLDWNQLAIDFYERVGAQGTKEWIPFRVAGEPLERLAAAALPIG